MNYSKIKLVDCKTFGTYNVTITIPHSETTPGKITEDLLLTQATLISRRNLTLIMRTKAKKYPVIRALHLGQLFVNNRQERGESGYLHVPILGLNAFRYPLRTCQVRRGFENVHQWCQRSHYRLCRGRNTCFNY